MVIIKQELMFIMCFPMLLCENVIPQVSNETEIGVD